MTIHERHEIDQLCHESEAYRELAVALCIADPVYWINAFVWFFEPRASAETKWIPALLFPKQNEYIAWAYDNMTKGRNFGCEKSREVGATWLTLALIVHQWLFTPQYVAKVGSYVEDKVYKKGDPGCHYYKMQWMIDNLPEWMKPAGWNPNRNINENRMENPANGSVITGGAPVPDFGRGDRCACIFFDELQDWPFAESSWNSAAQTTEVRIANGTPKGMNYYGTLMNPPKGRPSLRKFIIDWRDDGRKNHWVSYNTKPTVDDIDLDTAQLNEKFLARATEWGRGNGWAVGSSGTNAKTNNIPEDRHVEKPAGFVFYPWYSYQEIQKYLGDQASLSQEVDRDYQRSVRGRVYEQFQYVKKGNFPYNPKLPTYCGWDFGLDATSIVWVQYDPVSMRYIVIDYVEASGKLIDWFVPFFTANVPSGVLETYSQEEKEKIRSHTAWVIHGHFGDPSGKNTSQVSEFSAIDILGAYEIEVHTNSFAKAIPVRIKRTRPVLLRTCVDQVKAAQWITCMENYRFPERAESSQSTAAVSNPVHSRYSHGATAFEYFCVNNPHDNDNTGLALGDDGILRDSRYAMDEDTPAAHYGITGYGF